LAELEGRERAAYVRAMFDRVARRYDLMNRLMTLGGDLLWRRFAVRRAEVRAGGLLLDLGAGTGDVAFEALRQVDGLRVVGADFSLPMMRVGRRRPLGGRVAWCAADALHLPFPEGEFDVVISAFLTRNLPPKSLADGFAEQARVLKPGGRVVSLDTTRPPENRARPLIDFYLYRVLPLLGRLFSDDPAAYIYLADSTGGFKTADELAALMHQGGLAGVSFRTFAAGTVAVHWGIKR
jgi:demethylmenaquinone methyltransferase/2-methoxy-6-polyprenyl-1,4-benzoquinol methylase